MGGGGGVGLRRESRQEGLVFSNLRIEGRLKWVVDLFFSFVCKLVYKIGFSIVFYSLNQKKNGFVEYTVNISIADMHWIEGKMFSPKCDNHC